jgi:GalNAc-alpha-(1->4)-GalNAc-alpha-(1->3)-diNAcBac-PP-undecaprenol alpha-1,4-N-acetyl-D-galactosaminyltransferase
LKQKVIFIGGGLQAGGQERALTHAANAFAKNGIEVYILCIFKTEVFFELHPSIKIVWPILDRNTTNKFIYAFRLIPFIQKEVKRIQPQAVICFGDWFNAYTIIATRFIKTKVFITNRMGPNLNLGRIIEFLNRNTYKYAEGLIVQTKRAENIMKNKYPLKKTIVIPNAVQPVEVVNKQRKKRIVTVGRLSKEKGHEVLIKAFSKLDYDDWELHIVGDGNKKEELQEMVKQLNIEDRVLFYGHKKELSTILEQASIFVLPSFYEGFPNALVEAMSVPLTCVASDCVAGPAEIIQDGVNGFLFPPGDVEALAVILNRLILKPEVLPNIEREAYKIREILNFDRIALQFQNTVLHQ